MKKQVSVIKIGGNVIDQQGDLRAFLTAFARLEDYKMLVHGGGKLATAMASQLNIPQQIIDGRRITDEATLKIVTMVYAGYINKSVVAALQALNCNAIGLSGADGRLIRSHRRQHATLDYGFAGDVDEVNKVLLLQLFQAGYIPVIAPITADKEGQLLNTNADTIAQEIAQCLGNDFEVQLIYCFEKAGVLTDINDESSVIPCIDKTSFEQLKENGTIHTGMLPKLHNAFSALEKGVHKVVLGKWNALESLVSGHTGTSIVNE